MKPSFTQKIKVEGKGYLEFVEKYLKKVFTDILQSIGANKIDDYKKGVIAALSGKRKVVSRPTRSIRYKAMATLTCTKCNLKFLNNTQLNIHRSSTHTKGNMDESVIVGAIPIVDDLSLMDLTAQVDDIPSLELEERCPDDVEVIESNKCQIKSTDENDLQSQVKSMCELNNKQLLRVVNVKSSQLKKRIWGAIQEKSKYVWNSQKKQEKCKKNKRNYIVKIANWL